MRPTSALLADAEAADQLRVAFRILALQVVQQAAALADQLEQAPTGMVILGVHLEVLGEVVDPVAENGDLHFRRTRVRIVRAICPDDPALAVLRQSHWSSSTNGSGT